MSEDKNDERDLNKNIAAAARFDLGVAPRDREGAAAARLSGAAIRRRALAALRKDTDDEASLAAAAQVTLRNAVKPDNKAKVGANW